MLLLGGRGKGLPLTPLTDPIGKYARGIAIYGEIGKEMYDFLTNVCDKIPIMRFSGFYSISTSVSGSMLFAFRSASNTY